MGFQHTSTQPSSDGQHHHDQSNTTRKASRRHTAYHNNITGVSENLNKLSKTVFYTNWFCSFIQRPNVRLCMFVIFTSIAMTIGILTVYLTSPKSSKSCQRIFRRTMKSSLISSSQPRSVTVGDLNNDHQMDIVVANAGTDTIGIFLSHGNGTFTNQQIYSTGSGSHPYSTVISDFNNDTYLDIAVANYGINNIDVFLGTRNGTFVDRKVFSVGSSRPLFITIGDFNNDHRMDIAVANNGTNNIGILLGYGNGSFQNQTIYSTGYDSIPYSLAVGDFNKDNQPDIAVANYGTNNVGIFFGYGNGIFASQQTYTTFSKSNPCSIAVGDFNNDSQLDIAVANYGTGNVGILLGHDNGSFLSQITYSVGSNSHPQYITVRDVNKDNALDVVIADPSNDHVHVLPGYGNGSFALITTYDTTSGSSPFWVAVADFNNNNQSDIVVTNYGTSNVLLLIDYFIKPSARQTNHHVVSKEGMGFVAVSDFNNDHILDMIAIVADFIYILIGVGNQMFGKGITYSAGNRSAPQYLCIGDLNNDNRMDIVTANEGSDSVGVFLGNGDGNFANITSYPTGFDSSPRWVALGDINNDNVLDIVSANTGSNTVGILLGNGDSTFATVLTYSTELPYSVAIGRIDNDDHLDLVVVNGNDHIVVFHGYGNGTFTIWNELPTVKLSSSVSVALADFNSDNHLDIVVANTQTNNVGVLLGYGNGTFTAQTDYSTGSASKPCYIIVADLNNDNTSDIVATNLASDEIVIFYGYGNGSFKLSRTYSTGFGSKPCVITVADFDNNKQLEFVVALWGLGDIAILTEYYAAEFVNRTTYSTGSASQPYSVAVGEFSNDNRSDIVVANSGHGSLGILVGLDNGTFGMEMIYIIGTDSYPQYVMTCDINKDNHLDIISVNSKMNSISVIMGYGNGSFAEQLVYSTGNGSHPSAVVSGDVNNDTWLDLVVANEDAGSIGILYGFDYTSFYSQVTYSSMDSLRPTDIAVSDFNNDNYLDIAVTFLLSDNIGILLGYGNGSFTTLMFYSTGTGSYPHGIDVGDFDDDNQMDIVVTNWGANTIGIFLGYGNGSFAAITTFSTGDDFSPRAVAVGDFNNDSRLDIVVANYGNGSIGVLLGYGNGSFSNAQTYSTGKYSSPISVTVADINNDDRLDIAVANSDIDSVGILLGYGNGTFENQVTFSMDYQSYPNWITVGDFNSDNHLDIATSNEADNSVGILLGYGNGTFSAANYYSTGVGSLPYYIGIGDFNNDNISDIASANYGTNNIVVLFGLGDGSFLLGKPYSTGIASEPYALAVGDFNNDSRLDIIVANSFANNTGVFLAYSSESFGSMTTYSISDESQPHSVAIGDLNNDGWSDIVVANYGTDNVGILLGRSNRVFDPIVTYLTGNGSAPYSIAVADLNNDHYLDIVVTNSETDNIAILLGYGNGTFASTMTYSTGVRSNPYTVIIDDFNNDNISDIAVANSGTSNIFLLYGYGNGTFGNDTFYSLGYGYRPYSIVSKDLNQDNWMDIVIACYGTDHVEILIKMC